MRTDISVRTRLTAWYTAVLSLGLVVFSCTVWIALRHTLNADLSAALINQARGFEEYLRIEDTGDLPSLIHEMDEYSRSLLQDHILMVYDRTQELIYSNVGSPPPSPSKLLRSDKPEKLRWKHRSYMALRHAVPLKEGEFQIFLAVSSESVDKAINLLGWLLTSVVPIFIFCAAGGGYWLSQRALRPVDVITEKARTIGVKNLSERLPVPQTNDELQRLTETWNGMLERLETAVTKISRFTADASHELRTPVAIMRLAAENALRKRRSEAEYRAALQHVQRESEDMTDLISDLLFLARADVDDTSPGAEFFVLQKMIEGAWADFQALAAAKNITLTRQLPDASVIINGHSSDLRRMLLILLDNAIKYTPAGGLVSVQLERERANALLRVEDTGIGIPEEAKSRLFQRFFRVDPSRSKESGGFGLGLAIAYAIVQQHNASIEVQSKESGGSVFTISFPLSS